MARWHALAIGAGAMLLGARSIMVPAIFANATDTAVVIRFETLKTMTGDGSPARCIVRWPPKTTPEVVSGWSWDDEKWSPAANVKFDADTCVTEMRVEARSSAWVQFNGMCDDYEKYLRRNPLIPPLFESFQVVSSNWSVLLEGWDTAKVFERRFDACIYRID